MPDESKKSLGIYIHVPFCVRKCGYCGFYSIAPRDDAFKEAFEDSFDDAFEDAFEDALEKYAIAVEKQILNGSFLPRREVATFGIDHFDAHQYSVDSIFFGGGTPSLLSTEYIHKILNAVDSTFSVEKNAEITIESNPGTLNLEKLRGYKAAGINRISLGIQSFNDDELLQIGRIHDTKTALKTVELCRKAGFGNLNLDLIFSLPNQSFEIWESNLKKAISLSPEHLSIYGLQLEEGTEFFERFNAGEFDETSDELDRKMYHRTCDILMDSGFEHYEISNWAMPGFECRHNLKYWQFDEYLGIGPSAASFVNGFRFEVKPSAKDFISNYARDMRNATNAEQRTTLFSDVHKNTLRDSAGEFAFTALRTPDGISFFKFNAEFGIDFMSFYEKEKTEIEHFNRLGYIAIDENGIRLTRDGIDVSNSIMAIFV